MKAFVTKNKPVLFIGILLSLGLSKSWLMTASSQSNVDLASGGEITRNTETAPDSANVVTDNIRFIRQINDVEHEVTIKGKKIKFEVTAVPGNYDTDGNCTAVTAGNTPNLTTTCHLIQYKEEGLSDGVAYDHTNLSTLLAKIKKDFKKQKEDLLIAERQQKLDKANKKKCKYSSKMEEYENMDEDELDDLRTECKMNRALDPEKSSKEQLRAVRDEFEDEILRLLDGDEEDREKAEEMIEQLKSMGGGRFVSRYFDDLTEYSEARDQLEDEIPGIEDRIYQLAQDSVRNPYKGLSNSLEIERLMTKLDKITDKGLLRPGLRTGEARESYLPDLSGRLYDITEEIRTYAHDAAHNPENFLASARRSRGGLRRDDDDIRRDDDSRFRRMDFPNQSIPQMGSPAYFDGINGNSGINNGLNGNLGLGNNFGNGMHNGPGQAIGPGYVNGGNGSRFMNNGMNLSSGGSRFGRQGIPQVGGLRR